MGSRSRIAHPFPHQVRWVSFLLLSCWLVAAATVGLFILGMVEENSLFLRATVGGVILFTLMVMAAISTGHRLNCSVCANPVFAVRPCRKHQRARRFLGFSHRLGIAAESLLRSRFHCMYCGERIPLQKIDRQAEKKTHAGNLTHGERLILTSSVELPPRRG